jgi:hypothetical protein
MVPTAAPVPSNTGCCDTVADAELQRVGAGGGDGGRGIRDLGGGATGDQSPGVGQRVAGEQRVIGGGAGQPER